MGLLLCMEWGWGSYCVWNSDGALIVYGIVMGLTV